MEQSNLLFFAVGDEECTVITYCVLVPLVFGIFMARKGERGETSVEGNPDSIGFDCIP